MIFRVLQITMIIVHCHIDMPLGKKRLFPCAEDGVDYIPYLRAATSLKCQQLSMEAIDAELAGAEAALKYIKEKTVEMKKI